MPKVLIPLDGSQTAMRAVEYVTTLAGKFAEPLEAVLLAVIPPTGFSNQLLKGKSGDIRGSREPALESARASIKAATAVLSQAGVTAQEHVEVGYPEEIIVHYGSAHNCDMIVMGTRGLGATEGLLLGSVATKTVHLTDLPVLLVK